MCHTDKKARRMIRVRSRRMIRIRVGRVIKVRIICMSRVRARCMIRVRGMIRVRVRFQFTDLVQVVQVKVVQGSGQHIRIWVWMKARVGVEQT